MKQWRNEDIIAPTDAQRWEDGVDKSLKENVQNAGDLKKHAEDKSNPHGVTAAQTGAYTKSESDANDQETLTTAKQYTDEKKQEANTFTSQEVAKVKTDIQNGNVASASKLNTARKINGVDFDGTKDINVTANPNQRTIPANTNLDDLVEPGFWTSHSDGNTVSLINTPFENRTFTLHIETAWNNTRVFQTAKRVSNGIISVRYKTEDSPWSGWVRLARADGTTQTGLFSEVANMLRTPRKIAGVGFDGTADIAIPAGNIGAYTKSETDSNISNEINKFGNSLSIDVRNWVTGTTEPLNIVGTNVTNQTVNPYRFIFGQIKDIPAKVGDSVAIAYDWEASGLTVSGTFFPQFNNQPYSVANRETISPSATNQSGTSSFVTTVQAAWLAENAISNAIGFRADNLQGTITITNFRFLIASKDSGWLPASEEYLPELNKNLAGSSYYTKLPFDIGKNVYGEASNVITGVIIPVKRGQLYTVTSYDRDRHDRFNLVFSTSINRPIAGTALTFVMGNNGNVPMTWRATSDGWLGVQLATGSSDGFPSDGRIMIENRRQSSGTWKPAYDDITLKQQSMGARNLVPNSSFYNDTHGWGVNGHLTATSTGAYTRFVKAAVTATRATVSREVIDDRIKSGTEYTLGVMVYVESATVLANSSASTIFLRTNNGAMLDAPLGTIDWSRVGEWQFVTGTGITRPGTWVNRPQITIAIGENTICAIRVKEFVIVEGSKYLGWFPDSAEIALQRHLEETQQKVQTLEENTIRLTNQFPDHDFSKQLPRPVADGENMNVRYDSGDLVVENNHSTLMQRFYWGSPPLALSTGKAYNVAMYLNVGTVSNNKEFIVGTSNGENFTFSVEHSSPTWRHGTIGLTNWSAFSIWMPPGTALRLRELYIYEANTDITTARIEQLEKEIERLSKDNSLPPWEPRFEPGFMNYSGVGGIWHCQVERRGDLVALSGAIANSVEITTTGFDKILMARLPVGYRPKKTVNRVTAGSGRAILNIEIDPTGEVWMARYRGASTWDYSPVNFVGAWLNVGMTYLGEDI
ncbi:pyocin knob domain-containing protein [Enterococcus casseliflavus]|uniref:pyocin knob domain-containing protein n=1 Tax=Enterococcus casseliflavus TaxID=37734 RepID=UPI001F4FC256|nr:pyocin knob domain-containing protein [Enterococcus casseliflavus]